MHIPIVLFGGVVFLLPAIWNGFPFVFTDSLSYITSGIDLVAPLDRPIFYGLFIRATNTIANIWGTVICQSLLLSFLLVRLSIALFPDLKIKYLFFWMLLVGLLTPVSWFVGQLSPDIFTSILFLIILLWALTFKESTTIYAVFVGALITLCICVHSSNILIGIAINAVVLLWFFLNRETWIVCRKFALVVSLSFLSALLLIISSNVWSHYGITLNPTSKVFVLARVLEDGPGLKHLNKICQSVELKTCASLTLMNTARQIELDNPESNDPELRNLVASSFLWGGGLAAAGGIFSVNSEASLIIRGAITSHPIEQFGALMRNMGNQLVTFSVGEQLNSTIKLEAMNIFFREKFPGVFDNYLSSEQSLGKIRSITSFLNPIYYKVVILSSILLVSLYFIFLRVNIPSGKIAFTVCNLFFFLLSNALVTGGLSGVFDRYQSRVIWLLPAISILFLFGLLSMRLKQNADS